MARSASEAERGSVAPVYLAAVVLLVAVLALSVDLSGAWLVHTARVNDLAAARDEVTAAQAALEVKNADDPGREIATLLVRSLRANGFSGEVKVWCYEAPKGDLPATKRDSRRVSAWTAQVAEDYRGSIAKGFGMAPVRIAAATTSSAVFYSGGTTWRPATGGEPVGNGLYSFAANSSTPTFTPMSGLSSEGWPEPLKEAVSERISEIAAEAA